MSLPPADMFRHSTDLLPDALRLPAKPDPRQRVSAGAIAAHVEKLKAEGADPKTIPMLGFPAAAVNLGWLQECIYREWWYGKLTPEELRTRVREQLPEAVQRLKTCIIDLGNNGDYTDMNVHLVTKDDHGWYEYGFYVRLWADKRPWALEAR